ncbi:TetR/AcrR family transcriptional regulator [Mycobacterium sp. NPDC051804]|uniref:TetR/AcrR family transcriptional regulator n=1 Tax=Mycobacterium sp. NPDC051804 TaxID=3364295 RepID=UPI0037BA1189
MAATNVWRGQTQRDRSAERRAQLLEVGERLLGSDGSAAFTMRAVCREAHLSPRYFYESFDAREDLLVAVYNRVEEKLIAFIVGQMSNGPATTRDVLESCANFFEQDPRRARILLREPLADDTLRMHSASRTPSFIKALIPVLGPEVRDLMSREPERIELISTVLGGALVALYLDWADGRLHLPREAIADAAVAVVEALIGALMTERTGE